MAGVSLSGMASGLDTETIIAQLMAIEGRRVTAVQNRQSVVKQHQTDLTTIKTKVDAFKSAAAALSDAATWKATQTVDSSDTAHLGVSLLGGAGIGGHSIKIDKLASSAQHGFDFTPSATAGSIDLFYGGDPNATGASKVTIQVAANATAADVATAINANESAPVYAAVVKEGTVEKLVLSSRKTGRNSDFTVDSANLPGRLGEDTDYQRIGATLDASYWLDDETIARVSESNVVENAVPGVRLTLKGITSSPVSVTTTAAAIDKDAIGKKVQSLVDAYNGIVTSTRAELSEKSVPNATTSSDRLKGTLFGDSGLTSMLSQLKNQMTQTVTGLGLTSLADLGITVPKTTGGASSDDAKAGKMSYDSSVLTKALDSDWTKVRDLFSGKGATKGISSFISSFVDSQTGSKGILTGRITSDDSVMKDFTGQIGKLNDRMDAEQTRLKTQFAAMEAAMANSQRQQAWLTSQISSLPSR